jgi:oxygen-independent coproporphyrinogen-3 oxidase
LIAVNHALPRCRIATSGRSCVQSNHPAAGLVECVEQQLPERPMQITEMLSARVPRYTSYPTAPHFHAGIDSHTYGAWLKSVSPDQQLSLYIHIPFCSALCWFCGCHTTAVASYKPVSDYCDLLLREIALVAQALNTRRGVSHIHWGGGSPSKLHTRDILRIDNAIRTHFQVADDADAAVEIDPRGLEAGTVQAFRQAGVTRASIGLQDCDPKVQRAINRLQDDDETIQAISLIRDAGISSLNIDLVYGLPHQTIESWRKTVDFALQLNPDRLAVFGYAHVPHLKKHQALIDEASLPDVALRFQLAELAREIFCANGYVAVGLDHFAKPGDDLALAAAQGTMARNFQGYTTDSAPVLVGLGASAISALPQGYAQNVPTVPAYRALLQNDELPVGRGVELHARDCARRAIIERLMCDLRVDLGQVSARYGAETVDLSKALETLAPMAAKGIVHFGEGTLTIAPAWRSATRLVCAAFDDYLASDAIRHTTSI